MRRFVIMIEGEIESCIDTFNYYFTKYEYLNTFEKEYETLNEETLKAEKNGKGFIKIYYKDWKTMNLVTLEFINQVTNDLLPETFNHVNIKCSDYSIYKNKPQAIHNVIWLLKDGKPELDYSKIELKWKKNSLGFYRPSRNNEDVKYYWDYLNWLDKEDENTTWKFL